MKRSPVRFRQAAPELSSKKYRNPLFSQEKRVFCCPSSAIVSPDRRVGVGDTFFACSNQACLRRRAAAKPAIPRPSVQVAIEVKAQAGHAGGQETRAANDMCAGIGVVAAKGVVENRCEQNEVRWRQRGRIAVSPYTNQGVSRKSVRPSGITVKFFDRPQPLASFLAGRDNACIPTALPARRRRR